MNQLLTQINDFMYTYLLIFLLVGAGIYFSIRTGFVQLRRIADVGKILREKAQDGKEGRQEDQQIGVHKVVDLGQ